MEIIIKNIKYVRTHIPFLESLLDNSNTSVYVLHGKGNNKRDLIRNTISDFFLYFFSQIGVFKLFSFLHPYICNFILYNFFSVYFSS